MKLHCFTSLTIKRSLLITAAFSLCSVAVAQTTFPPVPTPIPQPTPVPQATPAPQSAASVGRAQNMAVMLAQRAAVARMQSTASSYRKAASLYGEAADLVYGISASLVRKYTFDQATALEDLGVKFGDHTALNQAVSLYEKVLTEINPENEAENWAIIQQHLGVAWRSLGEWQVDNDELLKKSATAFRQALRVYTEKQTPREWASTQNNLALTLMTLGERESRTDSLEQALQAYRDSLRVYTEDKAPTDWAATQVSIGTLLEILGQREHNPMRVTSAIHAYQLALDVLNVLLPENANEIRKKIRKAESLRSSLW